ncbi:FG-GAP-like repeat-containing protein [Polaribacter sp. HL-MS24]|uniref:FG-GAP-like repeat-containing protein n=1 Tax=Polaribacter sp. HL-MS24 TaxID=3077735 RepID=UPI0029345E61|nr:FG-GAP-like repeat-containing protein [Polaribacter sp. HL-MS24]WOC41108.1 FG-GAP-like repeat-containing protein [Polaribacter sp. HL-MS24]
MVPTIASGTATLSSYTLATTDNTTFTFALTLLGTSDGAEVLTLAGTVYNSATDSALISTTVPFNDLKAPTLTEVTAIAPSGNSETPSYVFNTDEAGTITSSIGFSTATNAITGNNTITFNTLAVGSYSGETLTVTDAAGNTSSLTLPDFLIDTTPPIITLTGFTIISSTLGTAYTDAGATAVDSIDGDITTNIVVGGDFVDVNTLGTYTITYNVADAATNAALEVIRTVNIIDDKIVTLDISEATIAENETFNVIATLSAAASKDVILNLNSVGDAKYNSDFTSNTEVRITTVAGSSLDSNNNQTLRYPRGVFVDNAGNLYVAQVNDGNLKKYAPGDIEGEILISGLSQPIDVSVDVNGDIYVLEQEAHRVTKWSSEGSGGTVVAGGNGYGADSNQLYKPSGFFIDTEGSIYIADTQNYRIQKWAPGAIEGVTVAGGNGEGREFNQLGNPRGVAVDAQGNIYVADGYYSRVQKWESGAIQGTTVLEGLNYTTDIFLDANENLYVLEASGHVLKKYLSKSTFGSVVAGGQRGSNANNLNQPENFFVDEIGNIYVSDSENQRVQKYDFSPQLVVKAGETVAELLFSGIRDTRDELDETIILNTSITNAVLASSTALTVNLTDINDPPTAAFTFSEENIKENSSTDVTLTATLSSLSGKEVQVVFTMDGTAVEDADYTLTSKTITIPANSLSGTITISTAGIAADGEVEALDTIVFKVAEITNATAIEDSATLFLESIENPEVALTVSQESIAENETFNVIATLSAAASKDVILNLNSVGDAKYNSDFTSNTEVRITTVAGSSLDSNNNQTLRYPRGVFVDNEGNLYVAQVYDGNLKKYAPGDIEGEILISGLSQPIDVSVDVNGDIYVLEQGAHRVTKWSSEGSGGTVVAGGNGYGAELNQLYNPSGFFIDTEGSIYIADTENHRIQKWAPGATEGVIVAGGNGSGGELNQLYNPRGVAVDAQGNIYVADEAYGRVQKWAPDAIQGETLIQDLRQPQSVSIDGAGSLYVLERDNHSIKKYPSNSSTGILVAGGQRGSSANNLNYPHNFFVDEIGNIYVSDSENQRVQKYNFSPQLVVKAGETVAELLFSGLEDTRDEDDETIILNTNITNGILVSTDALSVKLTDTSEIPTLKFEFNQDKITETSNTDVTLTATLSAVSGKEVKVIFSMEGTATELTDYKLSGKTITIPADSPSGTITISTVEIPADGVVEVLDTIIFKVTEITNATAETDTATLFLESNESPNVVLSASRTTIAEHETFNIVATLDAATSKDVVVGLKSIGTAIFDADFKRNSVIEIQTVAGGNGYGSAKNQVADPRGIHITENGTVYVADAANSRIQKWTPGAKEGQEVVITDGYSWGDVRDVFVDASGNIFYIGNYGRTVFKIPKGTNSKEIVAGGNDIGQASNQLSEAQSILVDTEGNIFIADTGNNRIQKWAPGATEGVTVAGGNGEGNSDNQLSYPHSFIIDLEGNLLIVDRSNNRIQKWVPGADSGETLFSYNEENNYYNTYPQGIDIDSEGNIFVLIEYYDNNWNQMSGILKHDKTSYESTMVVTSNGRGSQQDQLSDARNFAFDALGNLYISDNGNRRIQKYEFSLQVKVKAGETSGALVIAGIEDELNDEDEEFIVFTKTLASNAILNDTDELSIVILNNKITMTLQESPFLGLSEGAVSWGDYDNDGDKDVAVMGQSSSLGAVTILYQNNEGVFEDTEQNFVNVFGGDITWVDLNKDGYIDLVVSGYDGVERTPVTKVYINTIVGASNIFIEPTEGYELPQLFSTKMAWGDLDNDGDIDLAIAGQDAEDNFVFHVYFKDDTTNNYIRDDGFRYDGISNDGNGFINGDLKIVDSDLDGDNDIIFTGENRNGNAIGGTIFNTYIKASNNYNNYYNNYTPGLKNSSIEVAKLSVQSNNISVISNGQDDQGNLKLYFNSQEYQSDTYPILKKGDIAVADYNNDGKNDILFTGENQSGDPVTKLFKQVPASSNIAESYDFKDSGIELIGLRASTANWVDYDMDGDLDLFLTGVGESGAETLLYETEIANKKNSAPSQITGLELVDLGNGNVRFNWDLPEDDYATNLGYVIRVGTTPGGTELSNTESDLATGERLISKAPPIYNNFYDMQLDPGNYYWSVQAVDPGLKGGVFSEENSFTLVYEWKILNQGGIVDRTVAGVNNPVIKLGDVDNDNDLDVIYGSKTDGSSQLLKYDGTQLIRDNNSPLRYISNVTNTEVGDINGDGVADIIVNTAYDSNYYLNIYLSSNSDYIQQEVGAGLFNAKARVVDLNNDGQAEIFLVGMSSSSLSGIPKLYLYEYNVSPANGSGYFELNDVSDQIAALQYASYDLGDVDNDQDIDFVISGFSAENGFKTFVYENTTELGGSFTLEQTSNNLVAVKNGTTDFIDFDGDGDLDAVFTGESKDGDVFEIYMNTIIDGSATFSKLPNSLAPMREGKIDLGDFNGDGYADLLYSGTFSGSGEITKLNEYDSSTKTYVDSAFDVSDIIKAEVEFGDLDGDGDLDFVIAGKSNEEDQFGNNSNDNIFRTYINVRNQSATVLASKSSLRKPEYQGRNANIYALNQNFTVNDPPSAPVINDIVFLEEAEGSKDIPLEFTWNAATDDHTPSIGLTYALKIGTTPGGEEIMSSNSNANGVKKDAEKGNVEHNLKWKLSLPEGTYYWSVQAVDASYSGSEFSDPVQFKVSASGIDTDSDGDGIENDLDNCPDTPKGDAVDENGCSVDATLGDSNGDKTVNVTDLVTSVSYILGNNPTPFVFKAGDVNNDSFIDVRDIVGIVDIILSETSNKNRNSIKGFTYYSNTPVGDALFSWEGNDLYVSTDKEIAGMQLVFDKEFEYKVSENLANFNTLNFGKGSNNTLMIYSFSETSITPMENKIINQV